MDNNLVTLGPVIIPFIGVTATLILARRNLIQRYVALLASALALASSIMLVVENLNTGPQVYRLGNWIPPYGIVLVADLLSAYFLLMATTVMFGGFLYLLQAKDNCATYPAFVPLYLIMQTGLNGTLLTGDIITLFVFIELMVLASIALVALSDDRYGIEAAIKYIFISAMGSVLLLLGVAAVYATFGTLNLAHVAQLLATGERPFLAQAAAVMLMSAFLLKSAVFPFHYWELDIVSTAPPAVSSMLSSVSIKVGIYGIIRIVTLLFAVEAPVINNWLILIGIVGIFFGGLSALKTRHSGRMLAYSTFSQIGFILVGIGWGTPIALIGAIVYAFNHAFIKSSLLMLTGIIVSYTETRTGRLIELVGIGKQLPRMTGVLYFLGAMALSGLPPMNGFISKLGIVRGGIDSNSWVPLGLAVGAGILTLIYMMRAWQHMFQKSPNTNTAPLKSAGDSLLAPSLLIAVCVGLGIYAAPLIDLATKTIAQIHDPQIYINAVRLFGG